MLNSKYVSRVLMATLALSSSPLAFSSSVPEKDEEKAILCNAISSGNTDEDIFKKYFDAAQDGNPQSEHSLGQMYYWGFGVEKDLKQASTLYQSSAEKGYARAQYCLGSMYFEGEGVEKDIKKALHYYQLSADQGNPEALYALGEMHTLGEHVEKDLKQALHYYQLSAKQGSKLAQYKLGTIYSRGEGVEKDLKKALHFYQLSADKNHTQAQFTLGTMYYRGEGVEKDIKQALHYLQLSARRGNSFAQAYLGRLHLYGGGVEKDLKQALHYLELSADQGNAPAQYSLALIYDKGLGIKADFKKAAHYLRLSADNNDADAQAELGKAYFDGDESSWNVEKGLHYLQLSAAQENEEAQYSLGEIYFYGKGVEQDLQKAFYYLRLSLDQGNKKAQILLDKIPLILRKEAQDLLLVYKKDARMMEILENLQTIDVKKVDPKDVRMQSLYWLRLKNMTGRKLVETGNKFRTTAPQYAADCYIEALNKDAKVAKTELQKIRKSSNYIKYSSILESQKSCAHNNSIEYYVAFGDFLEREMYHEESARLKASDRPATTNPSTKTQPVSQSKKKSAPESVLQTAPANKNKKLSNTRESHEDREELRKPDPLFALGSHQPSQDKENNSMRHSPRDRSAALSDLSKRDALRNAPALSLTPVVAIPAVMNTRTTSTTTTTQEDAHIFDEPEKKEKRTLRLKNPMKRGGLYAMFRGQTKEEKEARRRENHKGRVLGELIEPEKKDLTSSVTHSYLESQSHFSITESEFDDEQSYLSQSEAEFDGVEGYVKHYYKPLWRLLKRSNVMFLDQVKIKSSTPIRSVLTLMKEKQLINGSINRGNVHVAKVGDQDAVFVGHMTHGSASYAHWYQDPAVVVNFLTFVAKCDSNIKLFIESKFGENCFSRELVADHAEGTTSPESKD